jgi:two-component system chemotaxis response regulator CheY
MPDVSQPVLVIDDFATMGRIMKGIVGQLGFADIDTSQSGEAALELLKLRKYGLILCDLEMESMSGAEFAVRARAHPYLVRCPIVSTTASREGAAQCVRDGIHDVADGFILKPFKAEDSQTKLSEIDNRRRARKQKLEQEPLLSRTKEAAVSA